MRTTRFLATIPPVRTAVAAAPFTTTLPPVRTTVLASAFSLALLACAEPVTTGTASAPLAVLGTENTIALSSGNNDLTGYNASDAYFHLAPVAGSVLVGIDGGYAGSGYALFLRNTSTTIPLPLIHASGAAGAGNAFALPGNTTYVLPPERSMMLVYNGSTWQGFVSTAMGDLPIVTSSPSRTIGGAAFTPSDARNTLVSYSIRISSSITLTTGAAGRVELLSNTGTPSTVRARCAGGLTGTLTVGLSLTGMTECTLTYVVPAGDQARLVSTNEVGTPTYTLTAVTEQVL